MPTPDPSFLDALETRMRTSLAAEERLNLRALKIRACALTALGGAACWLIFR